MRAPSLCYLDSLDGVDDRGAQLAQPALPDLRELERGGADSDITRRERGIGGDLERGIGDRGAQRIDVVGMYVCGGGLRAFREPRADNRRKQLGAIRMTDPGTDNRS